MGRINKYNKYQVIEGPGGYTVGEFPPGEQVQFDDILPEGANCATLRFFALEPGYADPLGFYTLNGQDVIVEPDEYNGMMAFSQDVLQIYEGELRLLKLVPITSIVVSVEFAKV